MAEKTPVYKNKAPGAVSGAFPVTTQSLNSYWQGLLDATNSGVVKITADNNGNRYAVDSSGNLVYALPGDNNIFISGRPYAMAEEVVAQLSTMSPGATKALEKSLGLKQTGIPGNAELTQRYLSEANKASVKNVSVAMGKQNGTLQQFTQKPLSPTDQAKVSIATGDITTGARRSRSVSVTQFSEGDARAILEQFYADTLGRRPDDAEVKKFNALINKQARKQPSVSTTTYGADGSSTTMSGGAGYSAADAQMAARKMAEADPEASAFLASTRYMDAFMNAIGSQA